MKKILIILALFTSLSYPQQIDKQLLINKNNQGGFNFYSNSGELLYEYSKENADSSALATLEKIYNTAKFDSTYTQPVAVFNLESSEMDYSIILVAFLGLCGTIGGLLLGNHLSNKSQLKLFRVQQKHQYKKEKLDRIKEKYSVFIAKALHQNNIILRYSKNEYKTDPFSRELFIQAKKLVINNTQMIEDLNKALFDFELLLDDTEINKKIHDLTEKITDNQNVFKPIENEEVDLTKLVKAYVLQKEKEII